jgi:hypothetical protein
MTNVAMAMKNTKAPLVVAKPSSALKAKALKTIAKHAKNAKTGSVPSSNCANSRTAAAINTWLMLIRVG